MHRVINTIILMAIAYFGGFTFSGLNMDNSGLEPQGGSMNEKATLGAGCFWCVEAIFQQLEGVDKVVPGYAGGETPDPSYEQVITGNTGHAEVCQITFDPSKITYKELLEIFWQIHDPTTLNRQGPDVGTQYRSIILYHSDEQKVIAEKQKLELNNENTFGQPVITEIKSLDIFYKAEDYHVDYYKNNPNQPYCTFMIKPKLEKFEKIFKDRLINED
mgnify:CR=1 FL=1